VQHLNEVGLKRLTPTITILARAEGLEAHARSVEARSQWGGPPGLPPAEGRRSARKADLRKATPKKADREVRPTSKLSHGGRRAR
jgi:hypothetical protein